MVHMVKADVGRSPAKNGIHLHKAGRLQGSVVVAPFNVIFERHAREIMLGIKQVGSQGEGEHERNDAGEEKPLPAQEVIKRTQEQHMQAQRNHGIVMAFAGAQEGLNAHAIDKHGKVSQRNGNRVTNHQVFPSFTFGSIQELFFRHDGIGSDAGAEELGVMGMVIIVRTLPDTVGSQRVHAENFEDNRRQRGFMQDGMMLVIVVNHEHARNKEAADDAAENFGGQVDIPNGSRQAGQHKAQRGKHIKPAFQAILHREFFGGKDKIFTGSQGLVREGTNVRNYFSGRLCFQRRCDQSHISG